MHSLQTGASSTCAPDSNDAEAQRRRCSLDSCLAQMRKQGASAGAPAVSILLSRKLGYTACKSRGRRRMVPAMLGLSE